MPNLVLSRKKNESFVISAPGARVTVTVIEIRGDKCRISIDAPREIPVHRSEVQSAIERREAK